ncbi:hypothetical protein MSAN_01181900 [Mycena sanguinolenta]|uniref:Uncharacterized protein n=1 Tax=Mycena sanguinolenta TaxID=230812 RepID=A0A8H6YMN1_9AGAR|nr:hypothetical protein MSAN_01181900 [Mycena sanguinolenta]
MSSTLILQRSSRFWIDKPGHPVFRLNNTLYKLDPAAISRSSPYLEGLCKAPGPGGTPQESSEAEPISLIQVDNAEFEIFLSIAYGRPPKAESWPHGSAAVPSLLRLLELARYYLSPATKEFVFEVLWTRRHYIPAAKLVNIGLVYGSKPLFKCGFGALASMRLRDLTSLDVDLIGLEVYVALARLIEALQEHRHILAAEEPQFRDGVQQLGNFDGNDTPAHSPSCRDNEACAVDWHQAWWNGMGRFLLDGREPLTWTDSFDQFKGFEFGRMDPLCISRMLARVKKADGNGHMFTMVDQVAAKLMEKIENCDEQGIF